MAESKEQPKLPVTGAPKSQLGGLEEKRPYTKAPHAELFWRLNVIAAKHKGVKVTDLPEAVQKDRVDLMNEINSRLGQVIFAEGP